MRKSYNQEKACKLEDAQRKIIMKSLPEGYFF